MRHSFLGGFALWSVCVTLSGAVIAWGHVALMGHNHAVQQTARWPIYGSKRVTLCKWARPCCGWVGMHKTYNLISRRGTCSKSWLGAHVWWPNVMIAYPSNLIRFERPQPPRIWKFGACCKGKCNSSKPISPIAVKLKKVAKSSRANCPVN